MSYPNRRCTGEGGGGGGRRRCRSVGLGGLGGLGKGA